MESLLHADELVGSVSVPQLALSFADCDDLHRRHPLRAAVIAFAFHCLQFLLNRDFVSFHPANAVRKESAAQSLTRSPPRDALSPSS